MSQRTSCFLLAIVLCAVMLLLLGPEMARAEQPKRLIPDKALCAKMLRFGKQAYQRGRYLDAKEYFRKAVQADPGSAVAWRYYDLSIIFGLAERVEQESDLVAPGVSKREQGTVAPAPSTPPPLSAPAPAQKGSGFKIIEDEGC